MSQILKKFVAICSQTRLKNRHLNIEGVSSSIITRLDVTCVDDSDTVKRRLLEFYPMEELEEAGLITPRGTPICSNGNIIFPYYIDTDVNMFAFTDARLKRMVFKCFKTQTAVPYNINGIEHAKEIHIFRIPLFVAKALSQNNEVHAVGIHDVDILVEDWPKYFTGKRIVVRMVDKKNKIVSMIINALRNTNTEVLVQQPGETYRRVAVAKKISRNQPRRQPPVLDHHPQRQPPVFDHQPQPLDPRPEHKKYGTPTPTHRWRTERKGKYMPW